jgi:hypothetical protein
MTTTVRIQSDLITKTLGKYFEFDQVWNLLDYDVDLRNLKQDLLPFCRESYQNNYRFIFLHYDTDYHITNDQPGLVLRNLQRILYSLDISNFFCLVITQKDLTSHLETLRLQETNDDVAISCIQHPLQENMHFDKIDIDYDSDKIVFKFMSLNRVKRFHRTMLYAFLKKENLLEHGAVSYGAKKVYK